ncbi:MAG: hypothetical protein LUP97_04175 [Methanoregula sp.]|nr:hypothetical protein [Methanoregula sp.]
MHPVMAQKIRPCTSSKFFPEQKHLHNAGHDEPAYSSNIVERATGPWKLPR